MAFATTNVQGGMLFPGCKIQVGDWSGTVGDAPGTMTLGGGRVYMTKFTGQDTTPSPTESLPYSVSVTAGVITLTVYNHQTITNGRFFIVYS